MVKLAHSEMQCHPTSHLAMSRFHQLAWKVKIFTESCPSKTFTFTNKSKNFTETRSSKNFHHWWLMVKPTHSERRGRVTLQLTLDTWPKPYPTSHLTVSQFHHEPSMVKIFTGSRLSKIFTFICKSKSFTETRLGKNFHLSGLLVKPIHIEMRGRVGFGRGWVTFT